MFVSIYGKSLPFADSIVNIVGTATGIQKTKGEVPFAKDIIQIVEDGINLGKTSENNDKENEGTNELEEEEEEEYTPRVERKHRDRTPEKEPLFYRSTSKFYIKTSHKYETSNKGVSTPISITELDIRVNPSQTIRATYLLKVQTSHVWYAPSFGFKVPNTGDTLFGTVIWPTHKNGRGVTMYSFMNQNPRYYTLQDQHAIDSELVFDTNTYPSSDVFNTIKIEIEYTSGCWQHRQRHRKNNLNGYLSLEMNRDLKGYTGHKLSILPGSSVVYEIFKD